MTAVSSPPMYLQFLDPNNSGAPLAGGLLFTYIAGTSTKQATWTDSTQSVQNANPIVLDSNGAAYVWLDSALLYKFVLAPKNDTDPPSSPIRSKDNISGNYTGLVEWTQIKYDITAAETAAGVMPVNYFYEPGDVRRYGAVGDGVTDDTAAIQRALSVQQDVFVLAGMNCKTTTALSMLSNQTLYGLGYESQISCTGVATNTLNILGKTRAVVRDLFIKYTGTATTGINGNAVLIGAASAFCSVLRCRLEGVRGGITINVSNDNIVAECDITSVTIAPPEGSWDISVYLGGSRNRIVDNRCFGGGASGIQLISDFTTSVDRNIVTNNHVSDHTQYGILAYANLPGGTTDKNIISNNQIWNITGLFETAGSRSKGAGIYIASAEYTVVSGNVIENTNVNTDVETLAPGAIGLNGVSCASVIGNVIKTPKWYGIYAAANGNGLGTLLIEGNMIASPTLTGIKVKEMINVSIVANSVNSGSDNGISFSFTGTASGLSVQNNRVRTCTNSAYLITNVQCPNITGNYGVSCINGLNVDLLTGAIITCNEFRNNTSNDVVVGASCSGLLHFDRNTVRGGGTNGVNDSSGLLYGINDVAGQTNVFAGIGLERTLTTSATPSALGSRMAAYGAATAITDLLNPMPGQVITIRATAACTIQHNTGAATTKIILSGAVNFIMAQNNTLTLEYPPGGPWYEISRKV